MSALKFEILAKCSRTNARVGKVETIHGSFDTPAFMPVGTRGSIRGLTPQQIKSTRSQIILANAYHLMLRPGPELVAELGGLHKFMGWDGPILTDSGGYQAFSMADINSVDDEGVTFRSIVDGSTVHLGPERAIEVQNLLGPDIIMAFDDCPPALVIDGQDDESGNIKTRPEVNPADYAKRLQVAHDRTIKWLVRCKDAHKRVEDQSLFGIIQGGTDFSLREKAVEAVCNIDLPGYAIGGVAVGEGPELIRKIVEHTAPLMPWAKPRYLMGVGYEKDIIAAVKAGVDMFDCVLPTRNGRNALAFCKSERLHLRNSQYKADPTVIEKGCSCLCCCGGFSRAYLRHLFASKEMLGPILVSIHNIRHFQSLLLDIRKAIREDSWPSLERDWPVLEATEARPVSTDTIT